MDFGQIPLFQLMKQKMDYHSAQQAVLAQNVANSDTPGYLAREIKAPDFAEMIKHRGMAQSLVTTDSKHIKTGLGNGGGANVSMRENTYELNPIGNNVVIEEEVMRVAENQAEYQKMLGIYRKTIEMFRIALGKAGGA